MFALSSLKLVSVAALLTQTLAVPTSSGATPAYSARDSSAVCQEHKVPLRITSENLIFNGTHFKDNYDLIDFVTQATRKDAATVFHPFGGKQNVTTDYYISGTFCSPKIPKDGHEKTVLLATHGLAYDRRYWDSSYKPSEYSFVQAAIKKGFSTFFYDRLGTGESQKISGYTNQESIQVEILAELAHRIREGQYTGSVGKPKSVVLVGHSFGSFVSNTLVGKYPALVDGVVLTGIGYSSPNYTAQLLLEAFAPRIARLLDPKQFNDLDTAYITFADIYSHVNTFFKAPNYEIEAAKYAQSISQPFSVAEFFSLTGRLAAPLFKGPVLITTGEFDYPVCAGECYSSYAAQAPAVKQLFAGSKALETYVHPGAGHGINLNKNATGFYNVITDFLVRQGF